MVNGYSNRFSGWGGEDDDMYNRIKHQGLKITRYPVKIARYAKVLIVRKIKLLILLEGKGLKWPPKEI